MSCEPDGQPPIIFDLGTGLAAYGDALGTGEFHADVLLTHLHWDHVQGCRSSPVHNPASTLDIHGPRQAEGLFGDVFAQLMCPPFSRSDPTA